MVSPAHDEETPLLVELLGDAEHLLVQGENLPDHVGKVLQPLDDLAPPGLEGDPVLGHHQGEHRQGEDLAGVGLQGERG